MERITVNCPCSCRIVGLMMGGNITGDKPPVQVTQVDEMCLEHVKLWQKACMGENRPMWEFHEWVRLFVLLDEGERFFEALKK